MDDAERGADAEMIFRVMAMQIRNTALRQWPPSAALVGATAIWGSTFVVTKDATEQMSVLGFLTWRFGIAAALLLLFGWREVRAMSPVVRRRSIVIGVFLGSGFIAQTYGLQATTAAVSSIVTGLMVVLTPVVASLLFGERVTRPAWGGVALATLGMAVLSLDRFSVSAGAFLTLLGAVLFAFHIASLGAWATPQDALALTAVQVAIATAICGLTGALLGELEAPRDSAAWSAVIYLAVAATCVGFGVQTWSQSRLKATRAALIMTLEPVFGGLFAIGLGGEALTWRIAVGGALIVTAMLIVELAARHGAEAMLPRIECC